MRQEKKYSWDAEEYAKHSSAQQLWAREVIAKLQLKGNESILDIGCGDGKVTAEIATLLPEGAVVGVDSSSDMISLAQKNFPQDRHPNLSFTVADARELPFAGEFDIVFSNAALHWIKDHRPIIAGIEKSLKSGGRLFLQMGGKGNAETLIATLAEIIKKNEWRSYFTDFAFPYGFYGPEEYTRWLQEANLVPARVELLPKDMSYKDTDGLAGWVRTTWLPYTDRIPAQRREEFISLLM